MNPKEETVLKIMQEADCYGRENMITPAKLFEKCKAHGFTSAKEVEAVIVGLIDQDVVEYEMDDKLQTSELWLL